MLNREYSPRMQSENRLLRQHPSGQPPVIVELSKFNEHESLVLKTYPPRSQALNDTVRRHYNADLTAKVPESRGFTFPLVLLVVAAVITYLLCF